jgi:hypothetical protein
MVKILATCVFIMTATASYATETPFPSDGTLTICARDAGPNNKDQCWSNEMGFKIELKGKWPAIPEEYRVSCVSEQAKDFAVYYSKLAVCIAGKYKASK